MNKNKKISLIGISGKAGVGKDLVGRIIQYLTSGAEEKYPFEEYEENFPKFGTILGYLLNWEIKKFAYKLKDIICLLIGGTRHQAQTWKIVKFADKLKDIVCLLIGCAREQLEGREFKEKELGEEWWYYTNTLFNNEDKELVSYTEANSFIKNSTKWYFIKPTPRMLLQQIGTDAMRNIIHPNTWVNAVFANYKVEGTISIAKSINNIQKVNIDLSNKKHRNLIRGEEIHKNISLIPNWIITDLRFPNELQAIKDRGGINIRVNRAKIVKLSENTSYVYNPLFDGPEHESETALDNSEFDYVIDNNGTIEELIKQVKEILIKEEIL